MLHVILKKHHKKESLSVVISTMLLVLFISGFISLSASSASGAPILQIKPITWNVIGLDSNDVSAGPDTFPVGARVCNTGDAPATNVTATLVFDSPLNNFFALQGNSSLTFSSLPSGASFRDIGPTGPVPSNCTDFYWNIKLTRNSGAYDTTQKYHIEVTADSLGVVSTPSNRELYVEHLISQNRNGVTGISGPTTVYVGNTYQYTVTGKTATGGYEQFVSFLNFPNVIFQILDVSATYSVPSAPNNTNNATYADACGWDPNVGSANYRSCIGPENYPGGKAGGNPISITFTVKIISAGTATLTSLIYDFSGSSYHYNNDLGVGPVNSLSVTAVNPAADLTITKTHSGNFAQGQTGATYTITATNSGSGPTSGTVTVADTLPSGLTATAISGTGWACTLATLTCTRSDVLAAGNSYTPITLTVNVASNAPASVTNTATVSGGGELNTGNDTATDPTTVTQVQPAGVPVPTMTEWGIIIFMTLVGIGSVYKLRRDRRA